VSKQQQEVSEGGQALQAGGDIVVHNGMTADQMSEIIVSLTKQISALTAEAQIEQERRFGELKDALLLEFAKSDTKANTEALSDPDFQYVVRDAHEAFARRGEADLKIELVNLISERSVYEASTRVAQTLNLAIELAGKLSREEYAALVAIFVVKEVVVSGGDPNIIIDKTDFLLKPFISFLPENGNSIEYLESIGCIKINNLISNPLSTIMHRKYAHAFGPGFDLEQLKSACENEANFGKVRQIIIENPNKFSVFYSFKDQTIFKFTHGTEPDLRLHLDRMHVDVECQNKLIELLNSTMATENQVIDEFRSKSSSIQALEKFWGISQTQQATATMVGKALAHSATVSKGCMNAPLNIWVN
jgi:hypothetical protein